MSPTEMSAEALPRETLLELVLRSRESETRAACDALLAKLGLDASVIGTEPAPEAGPPSRQLDVREFDSASRRRFAARLVDHCVVSRNFELALKLLRCLEPSLEGRYLDNAHALVERLESVTPSDNRAGLGWVGYHHVHKYTLSDRFFGRGVYLSDLNRWVMARDEAANAVLCLTALGGAGKSALAAWWLELSQASLREAGFRGAFWCSFYAKDFDFSDFVSQALSFVGQLEEKTVLGLSRRDRELALLDALARERFVLVVDGLERLMNGYAEVYERVVEETEDDRKVLSEEERSLVDPRDASFLSRLARPMASRVLITSRLVPADLEQTVGRPLPHVELVALGGFTQDEGLALWKSLLPEQPISDDLVAVLVKCDWHPLVINVLARAVAASGRDWDGWCRGSDAHDIRPLARMSLEEGRAYLINACLADLEAGARDILGFLATSGKPMPESAIVNALVGSAMDRSFVTVQPLREHLEILEKRGFVGVDHEESGRSFDVHPIVRGAIWGIITDPEQKRLMSRAVSELLAKPDHALDAEVTLDDLGQAISYYKVLVEAGEHDRAWEMLARKLWTPLSLGSEQHVLLDLLFLLLPEGNRLRLLALDSRREQAVSTQLLGDLLLSVGEGRAGSVQLLWAGALWLQIGNGQGFLEAWWSRTWQSLYEGRLYQTEVELRHMLVQAIAYGAMEIVPGIDCWLGLVLALRGCREDALESFRIAETSDNVRWWAQGVAEGYVYLNQPEEALVWIAKAVEHGGLADVRQKAWEFLTRGIAHLQQGDVESAENDLYEALTLAKRSRYTIIHAFAEAYLANIYLRSGRRELAEESVGNCFRVDKAGSYAIVAAHAYRIKALCAEARGDLAAAREAAQSAFLVAACDGPPFTYAAGLDGALAALERCGAGIPLARSRLPPDWREVLAELSSERQEALARIDRRARRQPLAEEEVRAAIQSRGDLYSIPADVHDWLVSVAGSPSNPLYVAIVLTCRAREIPVAEFRSAYEASPHKSLEVAFLELARDRIDVSRPRLARSLDESGQAAWVASNHAPALARFLDTDEARQRKEVFAIHRFDVDGVEAFLIDDVRRLAIDRAGELAKRWWYRVREANADLDVLVLAESLRDEQVTLQELVDTLPESGDHAILSALATIRVERAAARLEVRSLSKTEGWSEVQVQLRLQDLKRRLGWNDLDESERALLRFYETESPPAWRKALTLIEEIALRGATLGEYAAASRAFATGNAAALLRYLDYELAKDRAWTPPAEWQRTASASAADLRTRLESARFELGWLTSSQEVRDWWHGVEKLHGDAVALRILRELRKRDALLATGFLAHHDAGSDNFDALLAYLDAQRARPSASVDEETAAQATEAFKQSQYAAAIGLHQLTIRTRPSIAAYRELARAWELATHVPQSVAYDNVVNARIAAFALSEHDVVANHDRRALELARATKRLVDARGVPNAVWKAGGSIPLMTPFGLEVAPNWVPLFAGEGGGIHERALQHIELLRSRILSELGVNVPGLRVRANEGFPAGSYSMLFDEVPVASGSAPPGYRFTTRPRGELEELGVPFESSRLGDLEGAWIAEAAADAVPETWDVVQYPLRDLEMVVRRNLSIFVGHQEVSMRLAETALEPEFSRALSDGPDGSTLSALVTVIRALVEEGVPIVPFEALCRRFWQLFRKGIGGDALVRGVRLEPELTPGLPGNRELDRLLWVNPEIELSVSQGLIEHGDAHLLVLSARAMQAALESLSNPPRSAVLVVEDSVVRPYFRSLIRSEHPEMFVIAREELVGDWHARLVTAEHA